MAGHVHAPALVGAGLLDQGVESLLHRAPLQLVVETLALQEDLQDLAPHVAVVGRFKQPPQLAARLPLQLLQPRPRDLKSPQLPARLSLPIQPRDIQLS